MVYIGKVQVSGRSRKEEVGHMAPGLVGLTINKVKSNSYMCMNEWKGGKYRRQKGHFGSGSSCTFIQQLKHNLCATSPSFILYSSRPSSQHIGHISASSLVAFIMFSEIQ